MSPQYTQAEEELLLAIRSIDQKVSSLDHKVSSLDQKVSSLDHKVSSLDHKVSNLENTMKEGFNRVNERLDDFHDEFVAESASTRVLLHQAFSHISDQLSHDDEAPFVPKYPRIK